MLAGVPMGLLAMWQMQVCYQFGFDCSLSSPRSSLEGLLLLQRPVSVDRQPWCN